MVCARLATEQKKEKNRKENRKKNDGDEAITESHIIM